MIKSPTIAAEPPAERLARRATAAGVGFLVLVPAWQLGLRLAALGWEPPLAPVVAMAGAVLAAIGATLVVNRRLRRSATSDPHPTPQAAAAGTGPQRT